MGTPGVQNVKFSMYLQKYKQTNTERERGLYIQFSIEVGLLKSSCHSKARTPYENSKGSVALKILTQSFPRDTYSTPN